MLPVQALATTSLVFNNIKGFTCLSEVSTFFSFVLLGWNRLYTAGTRVIHRKTIPYPVPAAKRCVVPQPRDAFPGSFVYVSKSPCEHFFFSASCSGLCPLIQASSTSQSSQQNEAPLYVERHRVGAGANWKEAHPIVLNSS